jgi:hypothetical protein
VTENATLADCMSEGVAAESHGFAMSCAFRAAPAVLKFGAAIVAANFRI